MKRFTAIVTGGPGTGKTTMALTAPFPIHVMDVDRKMHLLAADLTNVTYNQYDPTLTGRHKISIVSAPDVHKAEAGFDPQADPKVYQQVVNEINKYIDMKEQGIPLPFETLVIDTVSRLGEHLEVLTKKLQRHATMTITDWKTYMGNWLEFLNGLISLSSYKPEEDPRCSCNIIVTSHETTYVDEITKEVRVLPAISGQTSERIAGFFQESYYLIPHIENNRMKVNVMVHADRKYRLTSQLSDFVIIPANFHRILDGEFSGECGKKWEEEQQRKGVQNTAIPSSALGKM